MFVFGMVQTIDITNNSFCFKTSAIWQFVGYGLLALKILVPLIIIVFGVIDFAKAVTSNDDKAIKKSAVSLVKRLIVGICIFFVPTIVKVVFDLIDNVANLDGIAECEECLLDPNSSTCETYITEAEEERKNNNQVIINNENLDSNQDENENFQDSSSGNENINYPSNNDTGTSSNGNLNTPSDDIDTPSVDANTPSNFNTYTNTKNGVIYNLYYQNDAKWGNTKYPDGVTISSRGCMISAIAVIASAYNNTITPLSVFNSSYRHSYPHYAIAAMTNNNFNCFASSNRTSSYVADELNKGNVVVVMVYGKSNGGASKFTSSQHYMALLDISGNNVYVGNGYGSGSYATTGWYSLNDVMTSVQYVGVCEVN